MRNIATAILAIALLSVASCKKESAHVINVNYPAAYVVNGASGNISVIRLSDNTVTETISLNGASFPHHIYMNPAKTKLAVAVTGTDLSVKQSTHGSLTSGYKILIIDAVTGAIDKEISLPKMAHNAVFSPNGLELWVGQSDTLESAVVVFRVSDWQPTDTVLVGDYVSEITFTADGSLAMATCTGADWINMIYADTKLIQCATYTLGRHPIGTWKGTVDYSYTNNEQAESISEIDIANDSTRSVTPCGFNPGYVAYKTLNDELWVSDATNGRVVIFTNSGGTWTPMHTITTGANAHAITFNTDESLAYVSNQDAGTISVINTATHTKTKDITVGQKPNGIVLKQ